MHYCQHCGTSWHTGHRCEAMTTPTQPPGPRITLSLAALNDLIAKDARIEALESNLHDAQAEAHRVQALLAHERAERVKDQQAIYDATARGDILEARCAELSEVLKRVALFLVQKYASQTWQSRWALAEAIRDKLKELGQ